MNIFKLYFCLPVKIVKKKNPLLGFWAFVQSLGYCAGPFIGGTLVQYLQNPPISNPADSDYGFRATTFVFCCPYIAMAIINSIRLFIKHLRHRQSEIQRREYERI